jgi:hypothetical protein
MTTIKRSIAALLATVLLGCASDRTRTPPCDGRLVPINAPVTGVTHERR